MRGAREKERGEGAVTGFGATPSPSPLRDSAGVLAGTVIVTVNFQ
jgi:hypothetical protein